MRRAVVGGAGIWIADLKGVCTAVLWQPGGKESDQFWLTISGDCRNPPSPIPQRTLLDHRYGRIPPTAPSTDVTSVAIPVPSGSDGRFILSCIAPPPCPDYGSFCKAFPPTPTMNYFSTLPRSPNPRPFIRITDHFFKHPPPLPYPLTPDPPTLPRLRIILLSIPPTPIRNYFSSTPPPLPLPLPRSPNPRPVPVPEYQSVLLSIHAPVPSTD